MTTHLTPHTTAPPQAPARAGAREWFALAVLMLPVLLISLDNTALSFAVPQLDQALRPTPLQLLWIVDIYPLLLAGLLVTMGMLGDRIGRRRLLLIGTAGFTLVSVYAAFTTDAAHLVAARAALGVFGAMLMPSTLALLRNVFLDADQRRLAVAIWASGFAGGTALGPIAGGLLLEHFWWGSIFLIALPVGVILLACGPFLLPESTNPNAGRLDPLGVIQSIGAMLPLVYGIKHLATAGADVTAVVAVAVGLAFGVAFVHRQLERAEPLLDVRLFTRPVFSASIAANFLCVFAMAGLIFFLSQHLQFVEGKGPVEASLSLVPGALFSIVMGLLAVQLAKVAPMHVLVPAGLGLAAVGYALGTTLAPGVPGWVIVTVFALVAGGAGLAETITNDAILAAVPRERAGAASGISETAYELGAALGVAVLGSVLTSVYQGTLDLPAGLPEDARAQAEGTIGGAVSAAASLPAPLADATVTAARIAFENGVVITSIIGGAVTVATAIGVGLVLRRAHRRTP